MTCVIGTALITSQNVCSHITMSLYILNVMYFKELLGSRSQLLFVSLGTKTGSVEMACMAQSCCDKIHLPAPLKLTIYHVVFSCLFHTKQSIEMTIKQV